MRALPAHRCTRIALGILLAAASIAPAAADDCERPGLAAPAVTEFSLIAASEYHRDLPPDADENVKKAKADAAITRAQAGFLGVATSTVADAVSRSTDAEIDASVKLAREIAEHMHEAARTDKQVGAASSVSGSTSAATKTGIPRVLSLAVENGAVERKDSGTSTTLSSSPYALLLLGKEDTDQTFNDYAHLRRVGVSATLDLDHSNSTGSGDFKADQISAVSTSVRLYGDRSARTTAFRDEWTRRVEGPLTEHARESVQRDVTVLRNSPEVLQLVMRQLATGPNEGELRKALRSTLLSETNQVDAAKAVEQTLTTQLCALIIRPIASGTISVGGVDREAVASAVRGIQSLNTAQTELQNLLDEFNSRPVVTFQHTWNRSDEGSDYSTLLLAADGQVHNLPLGSWGILLNASTSLNHNPDDSLDQDTIREFAASGSLEKSMENPIRIGNAAEGVTRISASVTGRYARQMDVNADIGVFHARAAVPLVRGFSLVVAVNYATRSETDSKDEVRLVGGLEFNGDTFAELADLQALFEQRR